MPMALEREMAAPTKECSGTTFRRLSIRSSNDEGFANSSRHPGCGCAAGTPVAAANPDRPANRNLEFSSAACSGFSGKKENSFGNHLHDRPLQISDHQQR